MFQQQWIQGRISCSEIGIWDGKLSAMGKTRLSKEMETDYCKKADEEIGQLSRKKYIIGEWKIEICNSYLELQDKIQDLQMGLHDLCDIAKTQ